MKISGKINNHFISSILIAVFLLVPVSIAAEEKKLDSFSRNEMIDSIVSGWKSWEKLSLSGKFKMEGLPLSPSVKIFMERDSSIIISLRAPFVGEAGRLEVSSDSVLAVNKMKKTYCKESLEGVMAFYPGTLADLQEIILGRVVIPGFGTLIETDYDNVEIYTDSFNEFSLIPSENALLEGVSYGYLIDGTMKPSVLLVIPESNPEINIIVSYSYNKKGYDINFEYESPTFTQDFKMELDNPDFEGKPIDPIKLNDKYRRLSLEQFVRSF